MGVDFITEADMVLDIPRRRWYFGSDPTIRYPLLQEPDVSPTVSVEAAEAVTLRDDEGQLLKESERIQLSDLLQRHEEVFGKSTQPTPYAGHTINVTSDVPIASPPYRLSPSRKLALQRELNSMLADGVIEECDSAYAAATVLVPKKDGSLQVCVDYRKLN
jgi:hypothetical protein